MRTRRNDYQQDRNEHQEDRNEHQEDRISELPDAVIHNILSFIDMKYAIQTSILSKRWRYIWTSLPTLNFNAELYSKRGDNKSFIDFVDKVLVLRDSSNILRLNLDWYQWKGTAHIVSHLNSTWILAAVRRNIQELSINGYCDVTFELFPRCLSTIKTLTKLELNIQGDHFCEFVLPSSMITLPRLKYLRLEWLQFWDQKLINMFFSSFPALESLIIRHCDFSDAILNISAPKLKHFEISCLEALYCPFKLYAPNLTFFSCSGDFSTDYSLENLCSLATAKIDMALPKYVQPSAEEKELFAQPVMIYLKALHNVKVLTLSSPCFIEVISRAPEILDNQSPGQFSNLQHLTLQTWLSRDSLDSILYLLKISPNIESLSLKIEQIKFNSRSFKDYWDTGLSFSCMLYHLKLVEIHWILGCVNELKFLEIVLKHAMVLEKVKVSSDTKYTKRMKKFSNKLLSFPKASPSIKFKFRF